jgi:O-methyltransferase domain
MTRRLIGLLLTLALLAASLAAQAQRPVEIPRIGVLDPISAADPHIEAFRQEPRDLGYAVCQIAEARIAAAGLTGRFTAVAADLLRGPYPSGADIITLGWILHDWNDDSCRTILRHCFAALPSAGALLVVEKVLNDDYSASPLTTAIDLYMLVICEPGARVRTEAEYRTLLEETGFCDVQVMRLEATRDVIVAKKPYTTRHG